VGSNGRPVLKTEQSLTSSKVLRHACGTHDGPQLHPFPNRVDENDIRVLNDLDQCKHCKNSQRAVQKTIIEDVHGDQLI